LGRAGHADQAAVDAFAEAFAHWRGEPALALAWGPMTEEGRSRFPGVGPLSTEDGLAMVDAALATGHRALSVLRVDAANVRAPTPVVLHDLIDLTPANRWPGTPEGEE
ncbi:hypothetical protein, partial [Amycolatopsis sp. NPDC003861]